MNKTIIQFRNKTVTNRHDHEHIHLHGPGDWASIIITVIVVTGMIIAVAVVACLVSIEKPQALIKEKKGGVNWVARTSYCFTTAVHCRYG